MTGIRSFLLDSSRRPGGWHLLLLVALWGGLAGCRPSASQAPAPDGATDPFPSNSEADQVLKELISAYSQAESYQDQATIQLNYRQRGDLHRDEAPFSVRWRRPNRILIKTYQLQLSSDGEHLHARVVDEASNDLDQQFVARSAPASLSIQELTADPVVDNVLRSGMGRFPIQLELLLGDNPLEVFADSTTEKTLLSEQIVEGRVCQRVRATTEEGSFVLWVDKESRELRRLEYPEQVVLQAMGGADVDRIRLVAEFHGAKLNAESADGAFLVSIPDGARKVRAFVMPPRPLSSRLIGRSPGDFHFTSEDGGRKSGQELLGKPTILTWFTKDEACRPALASLNRLREKLGAKPDVNILVVATEPSRTTNQQLRELLSQWDVELPLVRDLEAFGRDVFEIPGAPTTVLLDEKGRVQAFEIGANPELDIRLGDVLSQLRNGEDPAAQLLAAHRTESENYQRLLENGESPDGAVLAAPPTAIRPAASPKRWKIEESWGIDGFESAGNVIAISDGAQSTRLLGFDGFQTIVEMSAEGERIRRVTLDVPEEFAATYLRTAKDGQGDRYFAVSALRSPQVVIFDEKWRRITEYPPADQQHEGIHDCLLSDLDEDGNLELYVGFWGVVGVHALDLSGKRKWTNRAATNVLTLAPALPDAAEPPGLLVSRDLGPIYRVDAIHGRHKPPVRVGDRAIHQILAGQFSQLRSPASDQPVPQPSGKHAVYCGMSFHGTGQMLAIGLDGNLNELWSYALPSGSYSSEIQFVTPLTLPGNRPGWAFVGPDGSVHLVSSDGEESDNFAVGQVIHGLTAFPLGGGSRLVIATKERVAACDLRSQDAP